MKYGLNEDTLEQIKTVFNSFNEVEKVILYGSRAKGNFKNGSDIDITLFGNQLNQQILFQLIDKIDDLIGPLYNLTKDEIDFIKNYEIEFRLGEDTD